MVFMCATSFELSFWIRCTHKNTRTHNILKFIHRKVERTSVAQMKKFISISCILAICFANHASNVFTSIMISNTVYINHIMCVTVRGCRILIYVQILRKG